MLKKIFTITLVIALSLTSCSELTQALDTVANETINSTSGISQEKIGKGLKEALTNGITKQVTGLAKSNGFYNDQMVKIGLPKELQQVEKTLRDMGMGSLTDQGLLLINKAAEDAVGEAIPIFTQVITSMSFTDASKILMGNTDAATQYLKQSTQTSLRSKFEPIIENSFKKVGADKIWNKIITTYNKIPLVDDINPNLTDYTTDLALQGVFKKVAVEEQKIRTDISSRSSKLLNEVFSLQD